MRIMLAIGACLAYVAYLLERNDRRNLEDWIA
jgi:hypothetical protein